RRTASALLAARASDEATAQAHAGRNGVPLRLWGASRLQNPRARAVHLLGGRHGSRRAVPTGRVGLRVIRRQLELARANLVSSQLSDHRVVAKVSPLLRRRL